MLSPSVIYRHAIDLRCSIGGETEDVVLGCIENDNLNGTGSKLVEIFLAGISGCDTEWKTRWNWVESINVLKKKRDFTLQFASAQNE